MSSERPTLAQIQRWMQSVLMDGHGVIEAIRSPEAREHLDVSADGLESVILPSRALSGADRLEIYVDAYFERLLECLREDFAATRYAVGDELFDALAFGYLQHHPSRSYTLHVLGERFAGFLDQTQLHAQETPDDAPPSWPRFVVELATLERTLREVFDGPGSEGLTVLDPASLAQVDPGAWGSLRLVATPCLRLREFEHPVHEYWSAFKDGQSPVVAQPRRCYLAVSRQDYVVTRNELAHWEYELLVQLAHGHCVAEAIGQAVPLAGADFERELPVSLARWAAARYFLGFES